MSKKSPETEKLVRDAIKEIEQVAEKLPGIVIIHDLRDWSVVWMSPNGLKLLDTSLEEITKMTSEEYFSTYFNKEDTDDYVPKILGLLERNNSEDFCTHFHQVRFSRNSDWQWHMGSAKIFARDLEGKPLLTITMAIPIGAMHHMANKAERLLAENNFLRRNFHQYNKLSKREREILRLLALGKSATESAESLFLSMHTIETHRKNIREKLGTRRSS